MTSLRAATCCAALMAGAAFAPIAAAQSAAAQSSLTVAWYGGNWGEAFRTCVAEPFTKATGIKVVPEIGTSTVTLAKLQQQKGAPTIDVAWMDGGISELAQAAGVTGAIDPQAVPNLAKVSPEAVYKADGAVFAVGTGYYSLGLTYNTQKVKTPPTSWNDLWNPEFAGAVTIPSPANSSGVPFILFLNKIWGNPANDLSKTFAKLKTLDTALYFDSSGAASNAYQSGEAIVGAHFSVGAWDLADKGLPIGFVVPKEGVWATDARLHLVKGTPRAAEAARFIDTALTPQAATCLAEKLYLGPSVQGVSVAPDIERKLPWGVGGSVKNLQLFNWADINRDRGAITDAWNRELARQ
ncbi:ABC transporter substrate-binding protein [Azospirillum sp. A26]|uniref:ABC transporter substrate-binding protein n=1 Tax=Azospirillum sp. A26 TaxID=3160607 RepID=UPI00366A6385